jgi:predicted ABC-type ATPase
MGIVMLTQEEIKLEQKAYNFAKANKTVIARRVTDRDIYISEDDPVSVFMAGSPGAGKTEASKSLISKITNGKNDIIRIDPDELRNEFEDYTGSNSYVFQKGVSILVEKIHDLVLKQKQSFLLDGTLSNFDKSKENISRSLKRNRVVQILYVYQDPLLAWQFVCARELLEGRNIKIEHFIQQYFGARDAVNKLKAQFARSIKVDLLLKNNDNSNRTYKANIDKIDNHVPEKYIPEPLEELLKRD